MYLAISNVAWYHKRIDDFLNFIKSLGCQGVELAPSMFWDEPVESSSRERSELRQKIEDAGLRLTGLQALLFTRQELTLLSGGDVQRKMMLVYLTKMMDLCYDLGGAVLVFGSPRNRNRGNISIEVASAIAIDFFREVAKRAEERGLFFCIEPLGRTETDFINTVAEAENFIRDAGNPAGLALHIDTKGLIDENEVSAPYLIDSFSRAKHVHLNDPGLTPPGSTGFDHLLIKRQLDGSGYNHFLSIEMRRVDSSVEDSIRHAVNYVKRIYFGDTL